MRLITLELGANSYFGIYFLGYYVPWALHGLLAINDISDYIWHFPTTYRVLVLVRSINRAWGPYVFCWHLMSFESNIHGFMSLEKKLELWSWWMAYLAWWWRSLFAGFLSLVNGDVFLNFNVFLFSLCFILLGCCKSEKYRLRHALWGTSVLQFVIDFMFSYFGHLKEFLIAP